MNDPWAGPVAEPPKITAHQVGRIVELIADYTEAEARDLIHTLTPRVGYRCGSCGGRGKTHSSSCPTQGRLD